MNISVMVSVVCGVAALLLVIGLFVPGVREPLLGGTSEAKVLGVLTAKGAVVVALVGLFVAGMLYPIFKSNTGACLQAIDSMSIAMKEKLNLSEHGNRIIPVPVLEGLQSYFADVQQQCGDLKSGKQSRQVNVVAHPAKAPEWSYVKAGDTTFIGCSVNGKAIGAWHDCKTWSECSNGERERQKCEAEYQEYVAFDKDGKPLVPPELMVR